jgi:hypothetical protein
VTSRHLVHIVVIVTLGLACGACGGDDDGGGGDTPEALTGTFTLDQTSILGAFHITGDVDLFYHGVDDPDGGNGDYSDYTQWTMSGTATMGTTSFTDPDGHQCTLSDQAAQAIPAGVVFRVLKEDPPKARWLNLQMSWGYDCEGDSLGVIVNYQTRKGTMCAELADVTVGDLSSPSGTFTMDCMQALQPAIGTVVGAWTLAAAP